MPHNKACKLVDDYELQCAFEGPPGRGGENEKEGTKKRAKTAKKRTKKRAKKRTKMKKRNEHAICVLLITTGHLVRSIEVLSILSCNATFGRVEIIPHSTRN